MRRAPLALSLLLLPSPAVATTLGPLVELSVGPSGADQRSPGLSYDPGANNYVLVFQEDRGGSNGADIVAVRLTAAGTIRDPNGCPVLAAANRGGDETLPRVAFNPVDNSHLVTWTESRNIIPDVFAARFRASNCAADREIRISDDCNPSCTSCACASEGFSSVAVGPTAVYAAYQANLVGGSTEIRVRRLTPQLASLDPQPVAVSAAGAFRPAVAATDLGGVVAFELGTDVFVRGVPAMGPIPGPSAVITVAAAPLTQSRTQVSPLGDGLMIAWQDGRAGVQSEDVYGRRYDRTLAPVGLEAAIGVAPAAQLSPAVAGDDRLGLAVWQDRRNGVFNGLVYGARLVPTTGATRDPSGFPVIAVAGNSFEPAVARGPGDDFLVAAVRFGPPSRIFYRIVREEPPAGTLVAAPASAPADGTTRAVLTFTGASGASGFEVVDGTLYDLTLSPASAATLVQSDADPARPGVQLVTTAGRIRVSLVSTTVGVVTASLSSVEGTSTGSAQATFQSTPPEATDVVLGPPNATSADALVLTYTYTDPDGDPERGTTIRWTRNNALQSAFDDQLGIPAAATNRGDTWRARVTPSDGTEVGIPAFSNNLVIQNAAPTAEGVRIEPDVDVPSQTTLRLRYTYRDPDGDPESGTTITWRLNGVPQDDLQNQPRVPASRVEKGQRWQVVVQPRDGELFGPATTSAEVLIVNSPPGAFAGPDQTVTEGERVTLDGTRSSDPDPNDTLSFSWRQVTGPPVALEGAASATPSFVAPDVTEIVELTFELVVSDGDVDSNPDAVVIRVEPAQDRDGDGLDDRQEADLGTDPTNPDTDGDGLEDGAELELGADPLDADSDDDGVPDGLEGAACAGCPADPGLDADRDGRPAALDPDSDDDRLFDGTELGRTEPVPGGGGAFPYTGTERGAGVFTPDADPSTATDPTRADSDGDALADGEEDANQNGRVDDGESDPNDPQDPPRGCAGDEDCPDGFSCVNTQCVPDARPDAGVGSDAGPPDSGLPCPPLPANTECCVGGCNGGASIAPVCEAEDRPAVCPMQAELCNVGACSQRGLSSLQAAEAGCGCSATDARAGGGLSPWLAVLALPALRIRRRRSAPPSKRASARR